MLKLARYLKRYLAFIIVAIVLLVGQATLELSLPNLMSDIVNTGIQKGGIEEISPRAISGETLGSFSMLMSEDDIAAVQANYTPFDELDSKKQDSILAEFPGAKEQGAYILTGSDTDATDLAFMRAGYSTVLLIEKITELSGADIQFGEADANSMDFNMEALQELDFSLMTPEIVQEIKDSAMLADVSTMSTLSAVMNKSFYSALGANTDNIQTKYIMKTGAIMLLFSLILAACAIGASFGFSRTGAGIARDLRRDTYNKVMSFSSADMDGFSTSSLITRSTNDISQVQMMYTMALRMMIFAPIMGIGGVIMAMQKSNNMSWLIACAVGVILAVIIVFYFVVMPKFKVMQKLLDRLNMVSRENLTGLLVIRAFGTEKFQEKRFEEANSDYTKNSLFTGRAGATLMPVITLVMNALSLLIVWFGADQIRQSQMQVGDIMAFIQYAMHIVMSFMFIAMIFVMIPRAAVSAERVNAVLTRENSIVDPPQPKTLPGRSSGLLRFNNVSFKYPGADEYVLKNIDFTATPGQTTAFIGSTGSGKSTLVNLIPRFYDVTDGSITLDGVDIRELSQHELRENVSYVPQKGLLFSGDIAGNLRYGNDNASDADLEFAAKIAQADSFIAQKDGGFASEVSQGGSNFSGGQKQRLSIARAIVKNAPIYIFDDSFSALDYATDAKLRKALTQVTEKSTVMIVAQRISTIMHAERIIVLDKGNVVGMGTHQELLESCDTYREIAESQLDPEELAPAGQGAPKGGRNE